MWHWINDSQAWLSSALALVARNPEWALTVAFLASIIEAVAVIGTLMPGTFILMGVAGAAAAAGQPMVPFLVVALLGAVAGDFVSYWVGFRYRVSIRGKWPLARWPRLMEGSDRFFARYGTYSVALCRFVPVLRSMVPLVAGIAGMPRRQFLLANVASALVWAPAHIWPAQLAGLSIERMRDGDWGSAMLFGAGVLIFGVGAWLLHRRLTPRSRADQGMTIIPRGPPVC
jgi:membrane protein DedA with SNARE-associated domain